MNKLLSTKDYGLFHQHDMNRNTKDTRLLEKSMRSYGWIDAFPMLVVVGENKKLKIKAGHHRFVTAKKLEIPVKYVVCKDDISIQELEAATRPWCSTDYLDSFTRNNNDDYIAVKKYQEETGIPLACTISILGGECAGSNNKSKQFKRGEFRIVENKYATIIKDIVLHMKSNRLSFASTAFFVQALSRVIRVEQFNTAHFKGKISTYGSLMDKQVDVQSYMQEIERIYNRQSREAIPLTFMANQESKKRQKEFNMYKGV